MVYNGFELLINTELEPHFIDRNNINDPIPIVLKTKGDLLTMLIEMIIDQLELPNTMPELPVQTLVLLVFRHFQLAVELLDQGNLNSVRHTCWS